MGQFRKFLEVFFLLKDHFSGLSAWKTGLNRSAIDLNVLTVGEAQG